MAPTCARIVRSQLRTASAARRWGAKLEDTHSWLRQLVRSDFDLPIKREMQRISRQDAKKGHTDPTVLPDVHSQAMRETLFRRVPPDSTDDVPGFVAHIIDERFLTWLQNHLIGIVVQQPIECQSILWHITYFALKISTPALREPDVRTITVGQVQAALAEYTTKITGGHEGQSAEAMLSEQLWEESVPAGAVASANGAISRNHAQISKPLDRTGIHVRISKLMGKQIRKPETPTRAYHHNRSNGGDVDQQRDEDSPQHQAEQKEEEEEEEDYSSDDEDEEEEDEEDEALAEEGGRSIHEAEELVSHHQFWGTIPMNPLTAWALSHYLKYLTHFLPAGTKLRADASLLGRMDLGSR
jgi:hypothetical protein